MQPFNAVALIILIAVTLSPIGVMQQLPYKAGDWIRYSFQFKTPSGECGFTIYVEVKNADYPYVKYTAGIEKTEGDEKVCGSVYGWLILGLSFSSATPVNVEENPPGRGGFFTNPSFTGDVDLTGVEGRATYVNGVLKSAEIKLETPIVASVSISVVDSSIQFVKPSPLNALTSFLTQHSVPAAIAVAVVVVAVVIAVLTWRRQRHTVAAQPAPVASSASSG
ncbi:hypothetical protein [Desulfurococcus mucosus]|uniref:Uncharacterized protein n=1 Tax=Desulfurococcus mucosus (strain ATCC 35584 / DSM 2162 / JCM 9187 / O7/1) TaxID=765177 RepID=E8RA08_DESM0|nr:hypothetical protein [Desulfurococcus mucosus]ADV65334.1 hypothetical protein Desmu_1032 [Desulfurococcus mucosus DSM 2162]